MLCGVTGRASPIHRQQRNHRNNWQSMTIIDQSVPMFHDDVTHWIHGLHRPPVQNYSRFRAVSVFDDCSSAEGDICLWWGQANNPCSTVQALRGVSVFDQAVLLLPCYHYPRPVLNVVIKPYKLALLPTACRDNAFLVIGMQFSIGKIRKRSQNSITLHPIDRTDYHFHKR